MNLVSPDSVFYISQKVCLKSDQREPRSIKLKRHRRPEVCLRSREWVAFALAVLTAAKGRVGRAVVPTMDGG